MDCGRGWPDGRLCHCRLDAGEGRTDCLHSDHRSDSWSSGAAALAGNCCGGWRGSARAAGAVRIWLHVDERNSRAVRLYEANGYSCEGLEQDYYAPGRAALIYWKLLVPEACELITQFVACTQKNLSFAYNERNSCPSAIRTSPSQSWRCGLIPRRHFCTICWPGSQLAWSHCLWRWHLASPQE